MVTDVLVLMLVLLALLLAVFIYQIVTTPAPAVDAPTVIKSGAAPSAPALAPPDGPRHALPVPAAAWPASQTAPPGASRGRQSSSAALVVGGLAAVILGGWLILRTAPTGTACSHVIEVCSQGLVLLTGAELAGCAIAVAGLCCLAIAGARALR